MKISVIIPAYNVENYIEKCIESVINQTFRNIEIIVIDDGSTDGTTSIIRRYSKKDRRIVPIYKKNSGVSDSRNIGIDKFTGDYVFFLDSDDWIDEDYFENAVKVLNEHEIDILFNAWVVETDGITKDVFEKKAQFAMDQKTAIEKFLKQKLFGWGSVATFYKKDIIKRCKFDCKIRYGEDFYFKYQVIKKSNNFYYTPIVSYHYVRRMTSATKSYSLVKRIDDLIVIKRVMQAENNEVSDYLYFREYVPRLIEYAIFAITNSNNQNKTYGKKFRDEILLNFNKILHSKLATKTTKIKLIILKCHPLVIKCFGKIYMSQKKIICD